MIPSIKLSNNNNFPRRRRYLVLLAIEHYGKYKIINSINIESQAFAAYQINFFFIPRVNFKTPAFCLFSVIIYLRYEIKIEREGNFQMLDY